ncbi:hypothetical protein Bca4012_072153 [Brassica carinata]|uniref:Uncharacterized protein n=3 Tax=Brassica TaxID=3705 RepID=A0A0D3CEZ0_BRAOL|nr:unnamed protein product [Brassica napus]CDY09552.1 BnaC05g23670D [Brassica napus]VDD44153.1 unnamed protein product [Brassica oleracea]
MFVSYYIYLPLRILSSLGDFAVFLKSIGAVSTCSLLSLFWLEINKLPIFLIGVMLSFISPEEFGFIPIVSLYLFLLAGHP